MTVHPSRFCCANYSSSSPQPPPSKHHRTIAIIHSLSMNPYTYSRPTTTSDIPLNSKAQSSSSQPLPPSTIDVQSIRSQAAAALILILKSVFKEAQRILYLRSPSSSSSCAPASTFAN